MKTFAAFIGCCALSVSGAAAQQEPDVVVELRRSGDAMQAAVSVRGLLSDARFLSAMRSGFPLYLEYQVELRETRSNWFDREVSDAGVEFVVLHDPVREVFAVELADGREELRDEAELRRWLETVYLFEIPPDGDGTFYYAVTVNARTLSDADVDEVFDWLKGDDDTTSVRRHGFITRSARRLLVQVAPLPRASESGRSDRFRWP